MGYAHIKSNSIEPTMLCFLECTESLSSSFSFFILSFAFVLAIHHLSVEDLIIYISSQTKASFIYL
jgi:hypothetical protein